MNQNANVFITYVHKYKDSYQTIMCGYYMTGHTHMNTMNQILTMFLAIQYFKPQMLARK